MATDPSLPRLKPVRGSSRSVPALVGVLALGFIAAAIVTVLIRPPARLAQTHVASVIAKATGYRLVAEGIPRLTLFPETTLHLQRATLLPPDLLPPGAARGAQLLTAESITLQIEPWPLLRGIVNLRSVKLTRPVVNVSSAAKQTRPLAASTAAPPALPYVATLTIDDGKILVRDAAGRTTTLDAISARIHQPLTTAPARGEASLRYNGETVTGRFAMAAFAPLLSGDTVATEIKLSAVKSNVEFLGTLATAGTRHLKGKVAVDVPSLATLCKWLAIDPPAALAGRGASMHGAVEAAWGPSATPSATAEVTAAGAPAPPAASVGPPATTTAPGSADAWRIALRDATATLTGASPADEIRVSSLNGAVTAAGPGTPLALSTDIVVNGEQIAVEASIAELSALFSGRRLPAKLALTAPRGKLTIEGTASADIARPFVGTIAGETASLASLIDGFGNSGIGVGDTSEAARRKSQPAAAPSRLPQAPAKPLGPARITGTLMLGPGTAVVNDARVTFDATTATGRIGLDMTGPRAKLSGALRADRLNAALYAPLLGSTVATETATEGIGGTDPPSSPAAVTLAAALEAHLAALIEPATVTIEPPAAQVLATEAPTASPKSTRRADPYRAKAPAAPRVWSAAPMDLTFLRKLDADLDLAVDQVMAGPRTFSLPGLSARLSAGKLQVKADAVAAYGGSLDGRVAIDASETVPTLAAVLAARDMDTADLLSDLGLAPYIAGKGALAVNVTSKGRSQLDLVSGLAGTVSAKAGRSALVGWNISRDWLSILANRALGPFRPADRTPIDRFEASMRIDHGVARDAVFEVAGPVLGIKGQGEMKLASGELDLRGRIAAAIPPPLRLPVRVAGTWGKLSYGPDPDGGGFLDILGSLFGLTEAAPAIELAEPRLRSAMEAALRRPELDPGTRTTIRLMLDKAEAASR